MIFEDSSLRRCLSTCSAMKSKCRFLTFILLPAFFASAPLVSSAQNVSAKNQPMQAQRPTGAALLGLESGRSGRDLVTTTGIRGFKRPASANIHGVIIAAGEYKAPGIAPLKGVSYDVKTAIEIATRLGVTQYNLKVYRDDEVTLEGLRKSFAMLEDSIKLGDDVFIYFSGHGARHSISRGGDSRCAESLVTIDGQAYPDWEFEEVLLRLGAKAKKVVVFIDACHSGGVSTRSLSVGGIAPKSASLVNGPQECAQPTNLITRNISKRSMVPGSGGKNFVFVAAAQADEVAFDLPTSGGVASSAWLSCLQGYAVDTDRSGGLSARELMACAQVKINDELSKFPGLKPPKIHISGNPDMVLSYEEMKSDVSKVVPENLSEVSQVESPQTDPAKTDQKEASHQVNVAAVISPIATLNDIYEGRDDRRVVNVSVRKNQLKINKDRLDFTVSSKEDGFIYVLMAGSDSKTFDILFPNKIDTNNRITGGEAVRLPRSTWQLTAGGPPGTTTLLVLVSDGPRDFSKLTTVKGPFAVVPVNATSAAQLQLESMSSSEVMRNECRESLQRNLIISKSCVNTYGAAKFEIFEFK